jgi:hypothetical protein
VHLGRVHDGNFSLRHSVQTDSGVHPASYLMSTGNSYPRGLSDRGVKLNTQLHLVPRLRMREAIPPLPQHVLKVWCLIKQEIRGCMQNFQDWPPGARRANDIAPCHHVQLYHYFVSKSSEFCRHNPLCCFSMCLHCCKRKFHYRLSPETFGYALVRLRGFVLS